MKRTLCAAALALIIPAAAAVAQQSPGQIARAQALNNGAIVIGSLGPYAFTPLPPGQHNLAPTVATALTIPAGAAYATVCASGVGDIVNYTTDGVTVPTASVGMPLGAGSCVSLSGPAVLAAFRAFSTSGTLDVEYFQ